MADIVLEGHTLVVRKLRCHRLSSPTHEVYAPDGFTFDGDCHSFVCFGLGDVRTRVEGSHLVPCAPDCDCKED